MAVKVYLLAVIILSGWYANAQPPTVQWKKCYGGIGDEVANAVQQTFDGGYIVAGTANYNDGDVTDDHLSGTPDVWIVKLSAANAVQWKKCYGGSGVDRAYSIQQTIDSGYIICGTTTSTDGDVTGYVPVPGRPFWGAYWILKINKTGLLQWQETIQGTGFDFSEAYSIIQTRDTGYIVAGYDYNNSSGSFVNGSIIKLSPTGTIQWQSNGNIEHCIQQTKDGGYIVAGTLNNYVYSFKKLDSNGILQWQQYYGSMSGGYHSANSVIQVEDGGYIAVGYSDADDTTIHDNHGKADVWVVRTDSAGNLLWSKSYGGRRDDQGNTIKPTFDGGYIISATTDSWDGDVQNVNPALIDTLGAIAHTNIWMFKIDNAGTIVWQKTMGGNNWDITGAMQQTTDSGYIMAGAVVSNINASNGDINNTGFHWSSSNPNATGHDFFVVKFNKDVRILPVLLTGFTARLFNKNAQLTWTTSSELNNKHFEIQRSADGISFITIGIVNGNGSSDLNHNYSFTDINFFPLGKAYYRIKQVDFDGNFTFSPIEYLQSEKEAFTAYINPNPARNSFIVTIPSGFSKVHVNIYNDQTELIAQKNCNGGNTVFNTGNWQPGVYIVKLITQNGVTASRKVIVLR